MICKDCVHYEACCNWTEEEHGAMEIMTAEDGCDYFQDKSKFIELPCKVGDTVYYLTLELNNETKNFERKIKTTTVVCIKIDYSEAVYWLRNGNIFYNALIGREYFLTRKEAEEALKEWIKWVTG